MNFERKHYIYILIALVLSLAAIAQEQTILSELANFTEINTSRIFRVYDASTSEILLSSDAIYLNHVNGGINEVKITATDTQFMHDIDMTGNDINNCGNCGGSDNLTWQNSKVNNSGDNFTNEFSRMNISRCGQNSGNCATSATLDAMNYSNKNYLFFSSGRYYDTQTLSWRYTSSPDIEGSLIQVAGNQILFRFFERNSLTPKSSFVGDNVSARLYDGNGNLGFRVTNNETEFFNSSKPVIIQKLKSSGAGYEYVCVEMETGKLINSSIACDLI